MLLHAILYFLLAAGWQQRATDNSATAQAPSGPASNFRISGIVVDATSGRPLANAQLSIGAQGIRDSAQSAMTGEDGRFVFEGLAPGKYALFARRRGYLPQFYKQHEEFSTAIVVGPELNTEKLRFEMRPGASISGVVLDEMSEPVRNAQVILFHHALALGRRSNFQENSAQTDDLGRFHFGHLAPGTYFVAVSAQPWYVQRVTHHRLRQTDSSEQTVISSGTGVTVSGPMPVNTGVDEAAGDPDLDVVYPITFFPNAPDIAGAGAITVRAGDSETADFRLQPAPAVHVIVRTSAAAAGEPKQDESVWAQVMQPLAEGVEVSVPANPQQIAPGVLEIFGLPPGRFNLRFGVNEAGVSTSHSQTMQVASDMEMTLSEATALGAVSGIAKLENGAAPAPAPMIFLRSRASGEDIGTQMDQNGEFSFKEQTIPTGIYDVLMGQQSATAVKSMKASGAKVNGRSVEITGGQDVKLTVVLSQGTGQVTGFALKDGKGIDGAMIVLVPEVPDHNLVLFRRDQSDSDGSFLLPAVHPGKYTVLAIEDGWELEWLTPSVIQKYLPGGEVVQVTPNDKLEVKLKVQSR